MTFAEVQAGAAQRMLRIVAAYHPGPDPALPEGTGTLLMLGPHEPEFWPAFTRSPEYTDGAADPMDRWSARVIGAWAEAIGAVPLFPFGGPPFLPFIRWARDSGWVHASPVGLLVHASEGLFLSFRGALAMRDRLDLPPPPPSPCEICVTRPCLTACPVGALGGEGGYDVPRCKTFLRGPGNLSCMQGGCIVRLACPANRPHGRVPAHSAFHMHHFL